MCNGIAISCAPQAQHNPLYQSFTHTHTHKDTHTHTHTHTHANGVNYTCQQRQYDVGQSSIQFGADAFHGFPAAQVWGLQADVGGRDTQGGTHKRRSVATEGVLLFKGPQARRHTQKAVHTQGGTHKRRSVATTGVMLFKGPQATRYTQKAMHTQGGAHERRFVATAGVMLFKGGAGAGSRVERSEPYVEGSEPKVGGGGTGGRYGGGGRGGRTGG